jgi:transcriptional regulator with XRE-family HTH domain
MRRLQLTRQESIGERLRTLRQRRGFSIRRLAKASGLAVEAVRKIERGTTQNPRPQTLQALAEPLGVTVSELGGLPTIESLPGIKAHAYQENAHLTLKVDLPESVRLVARELDELSRRLELETNLVLTRRGRVRTSKTEPSCT